MPGTAKFDFASLQPFRQFSDLTHDQFYHPLPADWRIVITDIIDSTSAIREGRYKEVTRLGAATIAAVRNALMGADFPYCFGGDGASMALSPAHFEQAYHTLGSLKALARERYHMDLRVGSVQVVDLLSEGRKAEVGRHELHAGKMLAVFRGGARMLAEDKIKANPEAYGIPEPAAPRLSTKGLSCRWNNIPNKRGKVLSLIVASRSNTQDGTYENVLSMLDRVYMGQLDEANPVNHEQMTYKTVKQCVDDEKKMVLQPKTLGFLPRLAEIIAAVCIFRHGAPAVVVDKQHYREAMALHADYRKFDDGLRMVLDSSPEQVDTIRNWLEALHQQGKLYYGLHESDHSLMTCYVDNVYDGGHVHFIDGGDGGYALAAANLKKQMAGVPADTTAA